MKCMHCGTETEAQVAFCPNCGAEMPKEPGTETGTFATEPDFFAESFHAKILTMLKSNLFLTVCILFSVSVGVGLLHSNMQIFNLLITIFLWMVFAAARKNIVSTNALRNISGTVYAESVVLWVVTGILGFCVLGIIGVVFFMEQGSGLDLFRNTFARFNGFSIGGILSQESGDSVEKLLEQGSGLVAIIAIVAFLLAIGLLVVVNVCGIRSIHKFLQSLYRSTESNSNLCVKVGAAKGWMIVFAVCSAVSAAGGENVFNFISDGALCAAYILAYLLIKQFDTLEKA